MSTRIKVQAHVRAPFERVIETLADFASLGRWHPAMGDCTVEGEGVGAVRTYRMGDIVFREKLSEIAEGGRGYRYTQLEGAFASDVYDAYLWVSRAEGGAKVEWSAKIKGSSLPEAIVQPMVEGIFEMGLSATKAQLESA